MLGTLTQEISISSLHHMNQTCCHKERLKKYGRKECCHMTSPPRIRWSPKSENTQKNKTWQDGQPPAPMRKRHPALWITLTHVYPLLHPSYHDEVKPRRCRSLFHGYFNVLHPSYRDEVKPRRCRSLFHGYFNVLHPSYHDEVKPDYTYFPIESLAYTMNVPSSLRTQEIHHVFKK